MIEGPIGVGKTTPRACSANAGRCRRCSSARDNPFLERFYRDTARHALPVQLSFALQRAQQARELMTGAARHGPPGHRADFMPQNNDIFARLNLPEDEWQPTARSRRARGRATVASTSSSTCRRPEVLFSRIQKRGLPMELQISDAYLRSLVDAYNEFSPTTARRC